MNAKTSMVEIWGSDWSRATRNAKKSANIRLYAAKVAGRKPCQSLSIALLAKEAVATPGSET